MKKLSRSISVGLAVLAMNALQTACTDDSKKAEEAVKAGKEQTPAAPPPPQAPEPKSTATSEIVYFAFDDSRIQGENEALLGRVAEELKTEPAAKVKIEGHTDERGSTEYNLALGERRAQSVKAYLVNLGIDSKRLSATSLGEERPVADGHDEAAWSKNRRAVFVKAP